MAPVGFALADVGDVNFDNRDADGPNAIGKGDGGVGISARIDHRAIVTAVSLLQLVDEAAFVVRLVII